MTQVMQQHFGKKIRKIVLVGVAGVGKTTIGKLAAEKLGVLFLDVDVGFEEKEGSNIETLLERYGDTEFDKQLLAYFVEQINLDNATIFAAPARILNRKKFWDVVKLNGVSIHLQGELMDIFMRQDIWVNGRKLTKEEKLEKQKWKLEFNDYYKWRLKHCQKADYTVRIVGNKQIDTENLCEKLSEIRIHELEK
jgi:shikimate kinase